ncbi:MAG: 3,4-dihydroxy-2-butanone-4-phosphate synthase [Flavobacteriaceae bacterium]|jgi:3,4-dihydroxy 2-butanone 4-phosphate synthase/GTP cyclohydrolase II|nr:3,4-dihydroxy-2-butanone-4-phosphate synthase [Flavobacteriaceae bacterium]
MSHNDIRLNTIEEAIEDIRAGKVIIVVDDEDRENEGDFIAAAEMVSTEMINFMATHGRGLICAPLAQERCKELDLHPMVTNNTVLHQTAFTVSIDLKGHGCTTGISVYDRAKTIEFLVNDDAKPEDFGRPGHIFPLIAKEGGVLRRTGHTEAAVDLARLAGFKPAGILVEILNEDGSMARLPQLIEVAKKWNLKIISIEALVAYRMKHDSLIEKKEEFAIQTRFGVFNLKAYQQNTNGQVHLALTKGTWTAEESVLTRINSMIGNNDLLDALSGKLDKRIESAFEKINEEGRGVILFLNQENQSESLLKRLRVIKEQEGILDMDTPKLSGDEKDFGIGAQILHDLNVAKMKLMTNSEQAKRVGMTGYGLEITAYVKY